MRAPVTVALSVLVAGLLGAAEARAQDAGDDDALQRAVILFEESEQLYNEGELAQAAALLRRAYALHPNPTLLFNLARSLEGLGELDEAIETYERYLAEGEDIEDRGAIERRVQTLRTQRDRLANVETAADAPDVEPDPAPAPPPSASSGGGVDPAP